MIVDALIRKSDGAIICVRERLPKETWGSREIDGPELCVMEIDSAELRAMVSAADGRVISYPYREYDDDEGIAVSDSVKKVPIAKLKAGARITTRSLETAPLSKETNRVGGSKRVARTDDKLITKPSEV